MNGNIYLDNDYDSGVPGHPGTRFIVDLQSGSIDPPGLDLSDPDTVQKSEGSRSSNTPQLDDENSVPAELPEKLNVLFIDDDSVLRKLFVRSIRNVAPGWSVREAASGEAAVRIIEEEDFDLIFCDMYMASVEKQLLGTETVAVLRSNGVKARICGLSANDKEMEFKDAGADAFVFKPMPCDANTLTQTLRRILFQDGRFGELLNQSHTLLPDF
jgi:CheY-like chemotaxis protein